VAKPKAAISWSGGKDSCAALMRARPEFDVVATVTMLDEHGTRSRSHGLRPEILEAQAGQLGLRPFVGRCSWSTYDDAFADALARLPADVTHVVFGDILFDEHRAWADAMCRRCRLVAVEPLFGMSTESLFVEWVRTGNEATIVTARTGRLDRSWLGRRLSLDMLDDFRRLGVDPCGEQGEYHTVVTNGSLFRAPLALEFRETVQISDCWAIDAALVEPAFQR
jgi:diphthine-ammonia ligase